MVVGLPLGIAKPLSGVGADVNFVPGEGWKVEGVNLVGTEVSGDLEGAGIASPFVGLIDGDDEMSDAVGRPEGVAVRFSPCRMVGDKVPFRRIVGDSVGLSGAEKEGATV